jgi:DNA-binding NarL/FixJ family response regulator
MNAPGLPWSAEEEDLLRSLAAAGESAAAIAKRLKRSSEAVRKRAHKLDIRLAASQKGIGSRA